MPTIEVISVDAAQLPPFPRFTSLAIMAEVKRGIRSHRGLFIAALAKLSGAIVHLGNPGMDPNGPAWWANELVDFDEVQTLPQVDPDDPNDTWGAGQTARFRFKPSARSEVAHLLDLAVEASPISRAMFLTDYQLGPELGCIVKAGPVAALWDEHDTLGLRWNHLYKVGP